MSISLTDQIACVRRELGLRHRVYPGLVASGTMTQGWADFQVAAMQAVLSTLEGLADEATTQLPLGESP